MAARRLGDPSRDFCETPSNTVAGTQQVSSPFSSVLRSRHYFIFCSGSSLASQLLTTACPGAGQVRVAPTPVGGEQRWWLPSVHLSLLAQKSLFPFQGSERGDYNHYSPLTFYLMQSQILQVLILKMIIFLAPNNILFKIWDLIRKKITYILLHM